MTGIAKPRLHCGPYRPLLYPPRGWREEDGIIIRLGGLRGRKVLSETPRGRIISKAFSAIESMAIFNSQMAHLHPQVPIVAVDIV